MGVKKYQHEGMTFWLLDDSDQLGIPDELAALYLHKQREVQQKGINNNCYLIAEEIAQNGYSTGRIHSSYGTSNFVGWGNHCISFDQIDGRFIAVDYTASSNIDKNQGHFHLLGLTASSMRQLQKRLSNLYGGEWEVKDDRELAKKEGFQDLRNRIIDIIQRKK